MVASRAMLPDLDALDPNELKALIISQHELIVSRDSEIEQLKMLIAKLYQIEQDKRDAEQAAKRGEKTKIGFGGGTIRTYELNPTQRVKDHRTLQVSNNPGRVLDGDLKPFIEAYLREQIGKGESK